jgi:hypothetical protein
MKKLFAIAGATTLLVTLTGCAWQFDKFEKANEACGYPPSGVTVSDEGRTISIDGMGEEDYSGASYGDLICIIEAIETPDYIYNNIMATRALDGRQTQEFDGIEVSYSFHPDSGANIVFHKK